MPTALGFPDNSTLLKAISNGNLANFLGLTVSNVNNFFPKSDERQKDTWNNNSKGSDQPKSKMHKNSKIFYLPQA